MQQRREMGGPGSAAAERGPAGPGERERLDRGATTFVSPTNASGAAT